MPRVRTCACRTSARSAASSADRWPDEASPAFWLPLVFQYPSALLVGYMSRASTLICDKCVGLMRSHYPVSLGYDRVRFTAPVLLGDTIELSYRVVSADEAQAKLFGDVEVTNQHGKLVCVARHILKIIPAKG